MKPLRVIIDARPVLPIPTGFGRYISSLARGLAEIKNISYEPVFMTSPATPKELLQPFDQVVMSSKFLSPEEWIEIPSLLKRCDASLYHSPTFSALPWCPVPWTVTIHDLNHLHYGSAGKKIYYETLLKRFARKANSVVTVSKFSRNEIARWLRIPETDIPIVMNSIDKNLLQIPASEAVDSILGRFQLKRGGFFLSMTSEKPHKNAEMLIRAHASYLKQSRNAWPLVLTTQNFPGTPGLVQTAGLSELDGRALLSAAGAVVFPSRYEGFGLPPVEAAVCGIPVAVSDIEPHREGLVDLPEEAVLWVQADNEAAWVQALIRLEEGQIRAANRDERARIAARFDSAKMGSAMDRIYRSHLPK